MSATAPAANRPARWSWWAISAGASLLAASQWLHDPSVEYLVMWLVATAVSVATAFGVRGAERRWSIACSLFLLVSAGLAIPAQKNLWDVEHHWDAWRRRAAERGLAQLGRALDDAVAASVQSANEALDAPPDRSAAFKHLARANKGRDEHGVVLFKNDTAFAWAGTIRTPLDGAREGTTVLASPFYLALATTVRRGDARATATVLVAAEPPADRLSAPVATRLARELGLSGFNFGASVDTSGARGDLHFAVRSQRLFDVSTAMLEQGQVANGITESVRRRAGLACLGALACFIVGVWRATRVLSQRVAALAVGLACTALVSLSQYSNLTRLFNPAVYNTQLGGPLTANAGALAATSAFVLLGILAILRRPTQRLSRWWAVATVLLVAGLGPFLLRELSRGVIIPSHGVNAWLWLIWEIPLFLAAVSVLLAGAAAGAIVLGRSRGMPPYVAPVAATIAATLAPVVWQAPGQWPWWYTFLWIGAIGLLALSRQTRYVVVSAATVAALGATTLVWARAARGRVNLAENDLAGLSQPDSFALSLLKRFGTSLSAVDAPATRQALLLQYVGSELAPAEYPTALFAWPTDSAPAATFETAAIPLPITAVRRLVARARTTHEVVAEAVAADTAVELVMAAPSPNGGVTAVVVAPKSRLFETDPFARLLGLEVDQEGEPPYTVRLREPTRRDTAEGSAIWRRDGSKVHGDRVVQTGTSVAPAHVEVELRSLYDLVQRGALIVLLDLGIVGVLWLVSVVADGGAGRWLRARRRSWGRSYRARLSLALFAFFVIPALAFAVWSYDRLANDATQSRSLLVGETLRSVSSRESTADWLAAESDRLDAPLLLYRQGELRQASDTLYAELAAVGRFLEPDVEDALAIRAEETVSRVEHVDGTTALFGYRAIERRNATPVILAAPARADELSLGRRRRDLGVLVLFATAVGGLAALWLSGIAARQLARPIGTLSEAALAIAGGRRPPLEGEPTVEFYPVFTAFRRMAADLNASRTALEEAQRRTAAVLRNVASGVIAVDTNGRVTLANPRAESLLECTLPAGTVFAAAAPPELSELVAAFLAASDDEQEFEVEMDHRQLRGRLTRLERGGVVVTLDDVTDLARAQRVLAWGEMARQIAHEIKNPLTPIRLGVQHLRRARADQRVDFDRVLEHNVNQILVEIDRLDEIARAFSRYGSGPEERHPAEPTDVAAVVREVVALERLGEAQDIEWRERVDGVPPRAMARADELKEVLLNVMENARLAAARMVTVAVENGDRAVSIVVEDNGHGIGPDVLPRIFEPHFSTRTSGSGLGLAISRQIVDGWGGEIAVTSGVGEGTTVTIRLRAADSRGDES